LISPDDLLQACSIWDKINAPVRLRRFESGVLIVQAKGHSDEEIFAQLVALVKSSDGMQFGMSASDAARALGLPPALAKEELLAAEIRGKRIRMFVPVIIPSETKCKQQMVTRPL
jgi:ESCRT-II complex subunit VPS36